MPLDKTDLAAIEAIVEKVVERVVKPIKDDISSLKTDVSEMKPDLGILATIAQLDDIKKDKWLARIFSA